MNTTPNRGRARALPATLAACLLAGAALAQGLTVSGSGVAYGEPDQAVLTIGVSVAEANVRSALTEADDSMNAVRAALVAGGVAELDVRTVSFNVWRQDVYDDQGNLQGERYHVDHQFEVVVREVGRVGELLSAAVEAGANSVGGISFTISNPAELSATARAAAIQDARERATQLAELAGVTLGAPTAISETSYGAPVPQLDARYSAMASAAGSVAGGQLAVQVNVTVTYELNAAH